MVRGLGLDPKFFKVLSNQYQFESLGFKGPGVAFGARALFSAEVTRTFIEVPIQNVATD